MDDKHVKQAGMSLSEHKSSEGDPGLHFFRVGKRDYAMPVLDPRRTWCLGTANKFPDSRIILNSLPRPTMGSPLKAITLNISNRCNIRCSYCFANEKHPMETAGMTRKTAMCAIKSLVDSKSQFLHVRFFGGEPLLRFDLLEYVTHEAKRLAQKQEKKLTFSVFTNGTLLDDHIISFLNRHNFTVLVSVDGPRKYHDQYRCYPNGKGTYDSIIPGLKKLLESRRGRAVIARAVIPPWRQGLTGIVDHLFELGFNIVSFEHPWAPHDDEFAFRSEHIELQLQQYEELAEWFLERVCSGDFGKIGVHPFWEALNYIPDGKYFVQACGAGISGRTVSCNGEVYPCHAFLGNAEFLMGYAGEEINQDIKREFVSNITINNDICRNCFARLFCRARCHADAYLANRSIWEPNKYRCVIRQREFEVVLHIYVTLRDDHPHILKLLRGLCQRRGRGITY
ncbi:radical SAM protein [Dehalococcoidia bacterium]|nr:radical SAM protein [Dehalococcoidia bacterium]